MDVAAWLRDLGLGQYVSTFRESEIEADVLPELTEADLEKLGLPLGPRKRILKAIANLGEAQKTSGAESRAPPPKDTAERRQLTVMFCDLSGFRSFGFCIGGLHRVTSATMCAISSPPPHSISKRTMCRPTRLLYRGRLKWLGELSEEYAPLLHRGIGGGM